MLINTTEVYLDKNCIADVVLRLLRCRSADNGSTRICTKIVFVAGDDLIFPELTTATETANVYFFFPFSVD